MIFYKIVLRLQAKLPINIFFLRSVTFLYFTFDNFYEISIYHPIFYRNLQIESNNLPPNIKTYQRASWRTHSGLWLWHWFDTRCTTANSARWKANPKQSRKNYVDNKDNKKSVYPIAR